MGLLLLDRYLLSGLLYYTSWIFPLCVGSGQFKLVTQGIHMSTQCPLSISLCLKEQQDNPSWTGDCSYGNMTSQSALPCSYSDWTECGDNVTLVIPFDFSWTKTFTLVLEMTCENQTFIDSSLYSGSLLPGQPGLVVSHNSDVIRLTYVISVNCYPHYYSPSCSKLCRPRHDSFGHYTCDHKGEKVCMEGWNGENCHVAVCKAGCHEQHGSCDRPGECRCAFGWQGPLCDACRPYPGCKHGSCQGSPWQCICDHHWGGILCDKDLNPCGRDVYPCENGGVCENILPGEYRCVCTAMYTGKHCQIAMSGCLTDGCHNHGTCVVMDTHSHCKCTPGWTGHACQTEVNECSSSPCFHGLCQDQLNSFQCICESGWQGKLCDQDRDECLDNPCSNAIGCHNHVGGYSCECIVGWSGQNCQINLNECTVESCQNGATCVDTIGGFICTCPAGYQGDTCQYDIDECTGDPCKNGGKCSNTVGSYGCMCSEGYIGLQCETELDPCLSGPCHSLATCIHLAEGYRCLCPPHHTGRHCMEIVEIVPCGKDGCKGVACVSDGHLYSNGDTWSHDCNTCACNHGDIVCSQMMCGPRNCILHPDQLEEHYYCQENQSCLMDFKQECLTPPCLPWGLCDHSNQPEVTSHSAIEVKLNVNTSVLPRGVYLEAMCSAIRLLPSLVSMSYHMTIQVTCTISRVKVKGNVDVNIGTLMLKDVKMLQDISNHVIQDMLSNNNTLLRTVMSVHTDRSITVIVTPKTPWPMLVSCAVLVGAGLLSILLLVFCYSHRQTQLKQSTSQHQALLGQTNNQPATTVSRHGNPMFNPVLEEKYLQIKLGNYKSGRDSNSDSDVKKGVNEYSEISGYYENIMDEHSIGCGTDRTQSEGSNCGKYGRNLNVHKGTTGKHGDRRNSKHSGNHRNNYGDNSTRDGRHGHNHGDSESGCHGGRDGNHGNMKESKNFTNSDSNQSHYYANQEPSHQNVSGASSSYQFQGCNDFDISYQNVQSTESSDVHSHRSTPLSSASSSTSREIRIVLETNQKYHLNISDLQQS